MKTTLQFLMIVAACAAMLIAVRPTSAADAYFSPAGDRVITAETYVPASIAEVWEAVSTSTGWTAFLDTPTTLELRPGGKMEVLFDTSAPEGQRGSEGCTVLSYLPRRMLSFSWNAPPKFPDVRAGNKTIVVIELFPAGAARTLVRLKHHGWPSTQETTEQWNSAFAYFEKAWPSVLQALASHFAFKDGLHPSTLPSAGDPSLDPKNGWLYTFVALKRDDLLQTLTEEEKQQFGAHAQYISDRCKEGTVVFAGPCTDMKGPACVVLDARTEAQARTLMENDPAVKNGLMKAELHPVRLSFVRWRD